jgi:hypothetical protein
LAWIFWWFDKAEALKLWFLWDDTQAKKSESNIGEMIGKYTNKDWKILENIINKTIITSSWKSYTLIEAELDFLNRYNLPIPKKHWQDRIKEHLVW